MMMAAIEKRKIWYDERTVMKMDADPRRYHGLMTAEPTRQM